MVGTILDSGAGGAAPRPSDVDAGRSPGSCRSKSVRFELTGFSEDEQLALILEGARDCCAKPGAPDPIAFRAGSFAANADTLRAVARAGLQDRQQPQWQPDALAVRDRPASDRRSRRFACGACSTELPVALLDEGGGRSLRHLQIGAVSLAEIRAKRCCHAESGGRRRWSTMVGHSFELATRDGARANDILRHRFDGLCRWLADEVAERFPTRFVAELADVPVGHPSRRRATISQGDAPRADRDCRAWPTSDTSAASKPRQARRRHAPHLGAMLIRALPPSSAPFAPTANMAPIARLLTPTDGLQPGYVRGGHARRMRSGPDARQPRRRRVSRAQRGAIGRADRRARP